MASKLCTYGDFILIEDDVVGEASVVDPCDALAGLDGHAGGLEGQSTVVSAQLHCGICLGRQGQGQAADANSCGLSDLLHGRCLPGGLGLDLGADSAGTHAEGHCDCRFAERNELGVSYGVCGTVVAYKGGLYLFTAVEALQYPLEVLCQQDHRQMRLQAADAAR